MLIIGVACTVMRCLSICLSVCLPHSWILSKLVIVFSKNFSLSGSHAIIVFPYQTLWQYSDGNLPNVGIEWRWGRQKTVIFRQYLAPLDAVNGPTINCNVCSCIRPWQLDDTSHWVGGIVFFTGDGAEVFRTRSFNIMLKTTE